MRHTRNGTHGVGHIRSGTHTEWDTYGVGHTLSGIHPEWDTQSGTHPEWDTPGVGDTRSGTHTEWDILGVGYTWSGIHGVGHIRSGTYTEWDTHGGYCWISWSLGFGGRCSRPLNIKYGHSLYSICSDRFARRPVYSPVQQTDRRVNRPGRYSRHFGE